jgi:SAM-dependent methyltransferase
MPDHRTKLLIRELLGQRLERELHTMSTWVDYWNRPNCIYVNRRNLDAHFDCLARDLRPLIQPGASKPGTSKIVLDYGCGEALAAERLTDGCDMLYLYDAAPTIRARVHDRLAGNPRITVLDEVGLSRLADGGLDMILVVSVIQYMGRDDLQAALRLWHRLLRPGGELLIADVIEPGTSMLHDIRSQLVFAKRNGFLLPALAGLARVYFSSYRTVRRDQGFSTYRSDEMLRLLGDAGFDAIALPNNIGPSRHRRAFVGRKQRPHQWPRSAAKVQQRLPM